MQLLDRTREFSLTKQGCIFKQEMPELEDTLSKITGAP